MVLGIVFFYHYAFKKKVTFKAISPLIILTLGYIIIRLTALRALLGADESTTRLIERFPGFFLAFITYLRLLIFPFSLHMEYGDRLFVWTDPSVIVGIASIFLLFFFTLKRGAKSNCSKNARAKSRPGTGRKRGKGASPSLYDSLPQNRKKTIDQIVKHLEHQVE